jgi:hypothetical protein
MDTGVIDGELDRFDFTADDVRESITKLLGKWRLGDLVWHLRQRDVLIPAVDRIYGPRWIRLVDEEDKERKRNPKWFIFTLNDRFFRMSSRSGDYSIAERVVFEEVPDPSIPEPEETDSDMSFTVDQVRLAVAGIANNSASWTYFRSELINKEAVELPGVGYAYLIEDNDAEADSYGDTCGPVDFVFKVGDRHFRKLGYEDSYNGKEWNGTLEEVEAVPVRRTNWQAV